MVLPLLDESNCGNYNSNIMENITGSNFISCHLLAICIAHLYAPLKKTLFISINMINLKT